MGGNPLIYVGEEVGQHNDYSYRDDPAKAGDSRWVHRPATNWARMDRVQNGQIYKEILDLLDERQATPAFAHGGMEVVDAAHPHAFNHFGQDVAAPVHVQAH